MSRRHPTGPEPLDVVNEISDEGTPTTIRPLCLARWSRHERGYIEVRHPTTGEVAEIPFRDATQIWKDDVGQGARRRDEGRDRA